MGFPQSNSLQYFFHIPDKIRQQLQGPT